MATTYNITCTLANVTADKDNPTTVDSDATAELVFDASPAFPFNAYKVTVTGATAASVVGDDKRSVTVTLSEATKDVALSVTAWIDDNVNDKYVVVNGELYIIYNGRKAVRWNKRWLRNGL